MKISFKSLVASVLFVSAGFVAQVASAANVVNDYYITDLLKADSYADITGKFTKGTTFSDFYHFVVGPTELDAGFYANQGKVVGLSISNFDLLNVSTNKVVATGTSDDPGSFNIATTLLSQGEYVLRISGAVTGSSTGNYNGTLNITAVPEPETLGMMLGGLALMGVVARRKAKKNA